MTDKGAGRGIGRAIALSFAQAGAKGVILFSRTEEELRITKKLVEEVNPEITVEYRAGSVTNENDVKELVEDGIELLGQLDVLVPPFL